MLTRLGDSMIAGATVKCCSSSLFHSMMWLFEGLGLGFTQTDEEKRGEGERNLRSGRRSKFKKSKIEFEFCINGNAVFLLMPKSLSLSKVRTKRRYLIGVVRTAREQWC